MAALQISRMPVGIPSLNQPELLKPDSSLAVGGSLQRTAYEEHTGMESSSDGDEKKEEEEEGVRMELQKMRHLLDRMGQAQFTNERKGILKEWTRADWEVSFLDPLPNLLGLTKII